MSRPRRVEFPGAVYHVIARGNEKKPIFRNSEDRPRYLARLGECAARFGVSVYAYCLMTNHVHLAVETGSAPLSRVMLALHGWYSQDFNRRHERVGHLFQGRYSAFLVQAERYLLTLVRYIHLNPVRARLVTRAQDFDWSSDRAYRGKPAPPWLVTDVALAGLGHTRGAAMRAYASLMSGGEAVNYEELETYAQLIRGDEDFARRIVSHRDPEIVRRKLTVGRVGELVAGVARLSPKQFRLATGSIRGMTAFVGREVARIPLCRTATLFEKHESTLVKDVRRFEAELSSRADLRRLLEEVLGRASNSGIQR